MEVKGLRVGNLIKVYPKPGEEVILSVKEIQKDTIIGEFYKSPGFFLRASFKDINPIEIEEEWFLKLKFTKEPKGWINREGGIQFIISDMENYVSCLKGNYTSRIEGIELKYLHQFQNIYYVLAGTDFIVAYTG